MKKRNVKNQIMSLELEYFKFNFLKGYLSTQNLST